MQRIRRLAATWLCRPGNLLMLLAAGLLMLDHHWTPLTWGALSLVAGTLAMRRADD
jgi:hypothetical protein